jgi:hypothetical protein
MRVALWPRRMPDSRASGKSVINFSDYVPAQAVLEDGSKGEIGSPAAGSGLSSVAACAYGLATTVEMGHKGANYLGIGHDR